LGDFQNFSDFQIDSLSMKSVMVISKAFLKNKSLKTANATPSFDSESPSDLLPKDELPPSPHRLSRCRHHIVAVLTPYSDNEYEWSEASKNVPRVEQYFQEAKHSIIAIDGGCVGLLRRFCRGASGV
jgi:hypothetical protein